MSRYYKQMRHHRGEAARLLRERLARKEMGDAGYEKWVSTGNGGAFTMFGVVFILLFAAVVLTVVWLGY